MNLIQCFKLGRANFIQFSHVSRTFLTAGALRLCKPQHPKRLRQSGPGFNIMMAKNINKCRRLYQSSFDCFAILKRIPLQALQDFAGVKEGLKAPELSSFQAWGSHARTWTGHQVHWTQPSSPSDCFHCVSNHNISIITISIITSTIKIKWVAVFSICQ